MAHLALSLPWIFLRIRSWWQLGLIVVLLGLWYLFVTFKEKWQKHRTRGWPVVPGAIANIRAKKVDGGLNGVDYWKVTFDYTYRVAQEHSSSFSFNCVTEKMADGAIAGLKDKTVSVRYKPSDESKPVVWKDDVWDIWWDTYWELTHTTPAAGAS